MLNTQVRPIIARFYPYWPFLIIGLAWAYDFYSFTLQVAPGVMSQSVMTELKLGALQMSIATSCYFYAYGFMQVPAGILLDRFGPRRLMMTGLLATAAGATLYAIAEHFFTVTAAHLLMGIGTSFAYISVLFLALAWFPRQYFGILIGATELIGSIGALSAETPLLDFVKADGWRHSIFVLGMAGLFLALLTILVVRDRRPGLSDMSVQAITQKSKQSFASILKQMRQLLANPQIWIIGFAALLLWAPAVTFGALWGVQFLVRSFGYTETTAATVCMMMWLGTAAGAPFIGWWANRTLRRHIPMTVYGAIGCVATLFMLYIPSPSLGFVMLVLFLFGFASSGTCSSFALIRDLIPPNLVGSALGFNNMMVVIGGPIAQLLVGLILELIWSGHIVNGARWYSAHDFHVALLVLPLCFLAAAIISALFIDRQRALVCIVPQE